MSARFHVDARPVDEFREAARHEGIGRRDMPLMLRAEVGVCGELLEHLTHLDRARVEAVIHLGRDLQHLEVVPQTVQGDNKVVP